MSAPVDVLEVMDEAAAELSARSEAVACDDGLELREARAAVAELIAADHEYDAAHRDWEHVTAHDPDDTSEEQWQRVAGRYEAATMRRIAALARVGGAK